MTRGEFVEWCKQLAAFGLLVERPSSEAFREHDPVLAAHLVRIRDANADMRAYLIERLGRDRAWERERERLQRERTTWLLPESAGVVPSSLRSAIPGTVVVRSADKGKR